MLKNYLKTAFRNLQKNKGFTAINVLGLALGLATCLLIVFYVVDELSYDRYNEKADRIYRVNNDAKFGGKIISSAGTPTVLATVLKDDYPQVEKAIRLIANGSSFVKKGNENLKENKILFADPGLFDVFTLPMINGDAATALKEPNTVVITESTAKKYFNRTNVVGQVLILNDNSIFKITGIIRDVPKQSHFNADFFLSMSTRPDSKNNDWLGNSDFNTYVLLKQGADYKKLESKLPQVINKYMGPQLQRALNMSLADIEKSGNYFRLNLIPLTKIHLESNRNNELGQNGSLQYVHIFSAIALLILLIACVNFMNLSTASFSNRAREVGVRKVLGSSRKNLITQFLAESFLVTFGATVIALIIAWVLLPLFNQISGKELFVTAQSLGLLLPVLLIAILVISVLAGFYPAFFLSGFQPINVLKGKLSTGFKGGWLRSSLVVFQFSISIFLIIGTLVIYNQLNYIQSKNLGYDRNHVLVLQNVFVLGNQAKTFKNEVKQLQGVVNATLTVFTPTGSARSNNSLFPDPVPDPKKTILAQFWEVDEDYLNTLRIKLAHGRNFSNQLLTDSAGIIINESAAKLMGIENPVNKPLYFYDARMHFGKHNIIGVVKDFNISSLRENIIPVAMILGRNIGALNIRIKSSNMPALIAQIEDKWKAFSPNHHLEYSFMDEDFDATYRTDQRVGQIFMVFALLAIIIACLGLFGLAAYAAEQRTKEIGIRKVLGASVPTIVSILSRDFIKFVLIAIIISSPIAWVAMNKWLQDFAYRIGIEWWVFALAGILALLIAVLTVSFQAIKAALANPIKSLRTE